MIQWLLFNFRQLEQMTTRRRLMPGLKRESQYLKVTERFFVTKAYVYDFGSKKCNFSKSSGWLKKVLAQRILP